MLHVLLLCFACATTPPSPPAAPGQDEAAAGSRKDVDLAALEQALGEGALLIDVRTPGEWAGGHVPGAVHTPMPVATDDPILVKHGKDTPIYVICESGGRSGRVADQLAGAGYDVRNVTGGTGAWRSAGKPISTP